MLCVDLRASALSYVLLNLKGCCPALPQGVSPGGGGYSGLPLKLALGPGQPPRSIGAVSEK